MPIKSSSHTVQGKEALYLLDAENFFNLRADLVEFDNGGSGLAASNIQNAIVELESLISSTGTASVTSAELSAVAQDLSLRITSVAGMGGSSVTSAKLNSVSAAAASVDATLSNRVDSVAQAASVLSQVLSAQSAAIVSVNNRISTISTQFTSVQSAVSAVRQNVSALSQTNSVEHAALSARITSVGALGAGSVTSAEMNAVSIAAASVDAVLSGRIISVNDRISSLTLDNLTDVFAASPLDGQALKWNSALSRWEPQDDQTGGGGASVTSQELSVAIDSLSARITSVNTQAVNRDDTLSDVISIVDEALSSRIDTLSASLTSVAAAAPQHAIRIVSNVQSNATSTLADISGLILTIGANETWEIEGTVLISTSAATAGFRMGVSVGAMSLPRFVQFWRVSTTGQSAGGMGAAGLLQTSGVSTFLSLANVGGGAGGAAGINFKAIVNAASANNFQLKYSGIASVAQSPVHILPGSYLLGHKLK